MEWLFWVMLVAGGAWMVWMATFRTDQWVRLNEMHHRHRSENRNAVMKAGGIAWRVFSRMR